MRIDDNDIPHIEAQCAKCGYLFDMKYSLDCPLCHGTIVRGAALSYPGKLSSPYSLTEGDYADIAELDRMYAMEDPRDK